MINYKINKTIFTIELDTLAINGKPQNLKKATFLACKTFLQSQGETISKDSLLGLIWKDVIVSDASIFKQVHLVKKLFIKHGLPQDIIENIYGQGYKINYKIKTLEDVVISTIVDKPKESKTPINKLRLSSMLILLVLIILGIAVKYYSNHGPNVDILDDQSKKSITAIVNNDWQKGLEHVNSLINENIDGYSKGDFAFLYSSKGISQYNLQQYKQSIVSHEKALALYQEVNNVESQGRTHFNLALNYALLNENDSEEKRLYNIKKAIKYFKQATNKIGIIDTQLHLAKIHQDNKNFTKAIDAYRKTIEDAKSHSDEVGQMLAVNSLADIYTEINENEKAIVIGEEGLQLALRIGNARYIANSYRLMSDLYQDQHKTTKALSMIEQAIKYTLNNKSFTNLISKLLTYNNLLVQTYQYKKAQQLLTISKAYIAALNQEEPTNLIELYEGINFARMNNWQQAHLKLEEALDSSQKESLYYKKPLLESYFALASYFTDNHLKAIDIATTNFESKKNNQKTRAISALTLAYVYHSLERNTLADKWFAETIAIQNPEWLFEYQLFLKLQLERQQKNNSILMPQTISKILEIDDQMETIAQKAKVDEVLYSELINELRELIDIKKAEQ